MAQDVKVTPDNPLVITETNRELGTVTILPGGQIRVKTSADVRIEKLVKKSDT